MGERLLVAYGYKLRQQEKGIFKNIGFYDRIYKIALKLYMKLDNKITRNSNTHKGGVNIL